MELNLKASTILVWCLYQCSLCLGPFQHSPRLLPSQLSAVGALCATPALPHHSLKEKVNESLEETFLL